MRQGEYFKGEECGKHGKSWRYVSNGRCVDCVKNYDRNYRKRNLNPTPKKPKTPCTLCDNPRHKSSVYCEPCLEKKKLETRNRPKPTFREEIARVHAILSSPFRCYKDANPNDEPVTSTINWETGEGKTYG